MSQATMIVPIGSFTPDLWGRVRETAARSAREHEVIISMQSTQHFSWSALCDLAEWLRATLTRFRVRLAGALPATRALLRELGIDSSWFVSGVHAAGTATRILVV
jgi:hypothetical protein